MAADPGTHDITALLGQHHAGDRAAFDRLLPLVYQHLRRAARGQIGRHWAGCTLDTTALVHETYLQMVDDRTVDWQDRRHFFAIAARVMRRILVDHARHRGAKKRGGGARRIDLDAAALPVSDRLELVLAVDEALASLEAFNERLARVVECRYFAGLSEEETAEALGSSLRTVQRDWMRARAWLLKALG